MKDKYQMSKMDQLVDFLAEQVDKTEGEAWLTSLDIQYAYSQIPLDRKDAEQFNIQSIGSEALERTNFVRDFIDSPKCQQKSKI